MNQETIPHTRLLHRANKMISAENSMRRLNEFRQLEKYCDVIFIVGRSRCYAHKSVLAAAMDYFDIMFGGDFKEKDLTEIVLNDVDEMAFKILLSYVYTGHIDLVETTIKPILSLASYFRVECLISKCVAFIQDNVHTTNVLNYHLFASEIACNSLRAYTLELIQDNFVYIANSVEFLKTVTFPALKEFVGDDRICVDREEFVFELIRKWINYDRKKRCVHLVELMKQIRFKFIADDYVNNEILTDTVVTNCEDALRIVRDKDNDEKKQRSMKYIYLFGRMNYEDTPFIGVLRYNCYSSFANNSNNNNNNNNTDTATKTGEVMTQINRMRRMIDAGGFQIVASKRYIYMSTFNYISKKETFARFDDKNGWMDLKVPNIKNRLYNMVFLPSCDSIYANSSDVIYYYKTDTNSWHQVKASGYTTETGHSIFYGSLVSCRNVIYSFGGLYGSMNGTTVFNDVRLLDPRVGNWMKVAPMLQPCGDSASALLNDNIYVTGGYDRGNYKNTVQKFDIRTNRWQLVAPLRISRCGHCLLPCQNKLYSCGGSSIIEVYDSLRDKWTDGPTLGLLDEGKVYGSVL